VQTAKWAMEVYGRVETLHEDPVEPDLTLKTVGKKGLKPDHECGFRKERRPSRRPPRTADDPPYAATATLWKVEVTASNVWTFGVPSIILARVFNTSG